MNIAKDLTGPSIKDSVRRVHVPNGAPVGTGPAEYKKALEQNLPADVGAIVQRQYQGVVANHDKVRALRDSYRAAA